MTRDRGEDVDRAGGQGGVSGQTIGQGGVFGQTAVVWPPWASAPGPNVSRETSEPGAAAATAEEPSAGVGETPLADQVAIDAQRRSRLSGKTFPRPAQTRIITVANQKGGVGKTSTAVNLAAALATNGLRVLLIDIDPQGNASTALGAQHHSEIPSVYEVLLGGRPMIETVQACQDVGDLWCVPATIELAGAEIELVNRPQREFRLHQGLTELRQSLQHAGQPGLDYVIIDCPPSLGLLTLNAFVAAREVLIPIQCEYYALEGLSQLLNTVERIRAALNPELRLSAILLTMYDGRTNLARDVVQEIRTHFSDEALAVTIPRSVKISEAPGFGQSVITYDRNSTGALAYLEAALELAERGGRN